jgi:methylglutaconyl-CoA hydratase
MGLTDGDGPAAEGPATEIAAAEPVGLRGGPGGITLTRDDRGVVTCTLDDPPTRNALGTAALRDSGRALAELSADPSVRVVVLTGAGGVFSSGADRRELGDPAAVEAAVGLLSEILIRIEESPVPVVCRVNGAAFGAGLAIVAAADIAVAVPGAVFGFPEVRFGLVPGPAAAASLARIGQTAALDLLLTGRRFGADEAVRLGLIAAVAGGGVLNPAGAAGDGLDPAVAAGALDSAVAAVVGDLLAGDPAALRATRALVRGLAPAPLSARLRSATTAAIT